MKSNGVQFPPEIQAMLYKSILEEMELNPIADTKSLAFRAMVTQNFTKKLRNKGLITDEKLSEFS